MEKNKKRNELSIFEEFRLKLPTNARMPKHYPSEDSLRKLNILCRVDFDNTPISWWKKNSHGRLVQVNEFGQLIFSGEECFKIKNKSKILVTVNKYKFPVTWWTKDKNGELVQLNIKDEEADIKFKIKSWLRNKAIDNVGLEIRSMKKKAYEYSKEKLEEMIEKEERKIIKKQGMKWVKRAAMLYFGVGFLPGA